MVSLRPGRLGEGGAIDGVGTDKFKHCLVMCRVTRECCNRNPGCAAIIHDIANLTEDWDDPVDQGDMEANGFGLIFGLCSGKGCEAACGEKYPALRKSGH